MFLKETTASFKVSTIGFFIFCLWFERRFSRQRMRSAHTVMIVSKTFSTVPPLPSAIKLLAYDIFHSKVAKKG
jgi:hypothetical protein